MPDDTFLRSRLASLTDHHRAPCKLERLAGDASTRVYYRASYPEGHTAVIMLQPDPGLNQEASFLDVHRFLERLGLPVPRIHFHDPAQGVIVLEDLGDDLLETVADRSDESELRALYTTAVDILLRLCRKTRGLTSGCGAFSLAFDEEKLMEELRFFMTHFVDGLCAAHPPRSAMTALDEFFHKITTMLAAEPRVFTHRDYHSRNLIVRHGRLVMIDFQDARMGPAQYDLASLLRDSYLTLPDSLVSELVDHYLSEGKQTDKARFLYVFDVMSLQRNIKALGTFGYQISVRRSTRYASAIPRTGAYIARAIARYAEFAGFRSAIEDFISAPAVAFSLVEKESDGETAEEPQT